MGLDAGGSGRRQSQHLRVRALVSRRPDLGAEADQQARSQRPSDSLPLELVLAQPARRRWPQARCCRSGARCRRRAQRRRPQDAGYLPKTAGRSGPVCKLSVGHGPGPTETNPRTAVPSALPTIELQPPFEHAKEIVPATTPTGNNNSHIVSSIEPLSSRKSHAGIVSCISIFKTFWAASTNGFRNLTFIIILQFTLNYQGT